MFFRRRVSLVIGVASVGLLLGAQNRSFPFAWIGGPPTAQAQLAVPGDHYLGYTAKVSGALGGTKLPSTLSAQLEDQFRSATCAVKKEVALYNPATENNEAPSNPTVHQGLRTKKGEAFSSPAHRLCRMRAALHRWTRMPSWREMPRPYTAEITGVQFLVGTR